MGPSRLNGSLFFLILGILTLTPPSTGAFAFTRDQLLQTVPSAFKNKSVRLPTAGGESSSLLGGLVPDVTAAFDDLSDDSLGAEDGPAVASSSGGSVKYTNPPPNLTTLKPGSELTYAQNMTVNVVMVGLNPGFAGSPSYTPLSVDEGIVRTNLLPQYVPITRAWHENNPTNPNFPYDSFIPNNDYHMAVNLNYQFYYADPSFTAALTNFLFGNGQTPGAAIPQPPLHFNNDPMALPPHYTGPVCNTPCQPSGPEDDACVEIFPGYFGVPPSADPYCKPITTFQNYYNQQVSRTATIEHNFYVESSMLEGWFLANIQALGARDFFGHPLPPPDTTQPTVIFVNLYGQPNFQYHVITDFAEPQPDMPFPIGYYDSRKTIATGGRMPGHRVQIVDLSAGPEAWTANFAVDVFPDGPDPDFLPDHNPDGDILGNDTTIIPAWEYVNQGDPASFVPKLAPLPGPNLYLYSWGNVCSPDLSFCLPPDFMANPAYGGFPLRLSFDLGAYIRFAFVNTLASPAPVFNPMNSYPPYNLFRRGGSAWNLPESLADLDDVQLDITEFVGPGGTANYGICNTPNCYRGDVIASYLGTLEPWRHFSVSVEEGNFDEIKDCFHSYATAFSPDPQQWDSCYGRRIPFQLADGRQLGYPGSDFFFWDFDRRYSLMEFPLYHKGAVDAILAQSVFHLSSDDALLFPFAGFADHDYRHARAYASLVNMTALFLQPGRSFSYVMSHETGHELSMSHPHDGFDPQLGEYRPFGIVNFAWLGDEQFSNMSYLELSGGYGSFDRANHARVLIAKLIEHTNFLATKIFASPDAGIESKALLKADNLVAAAIADPDGNGGTGVNAALEAYTTLGRAARNLKLKISPKEWPDYIPLKRDWLIKVYSDPAMDRTEDMRVEEAPVDEGAKTVLDEVLRSGE